MSGTVKHSAENTRSAANGIFTLIEALAHATAACPAHLPLLLELLQRIRRRVSAEDAPVAPGSTRSREEMTELSARIASPEFITKHVGGILQGSTATGFETNVVQNSGTGRLTQRWVFGSDSTIYTKLYSDRLGLHSYRVLKLLWENGFGKHSRFQVSEPLSFLPEHNLLLMRGVGGRPLGEAIQGEAVLDLVAGTRAAARWLAALHRSSVRAGEPERPWDSLKLFRVGVRLMKAVAAHPAQCHALLSLLRLLRRHVLKLPSGRPASQTHGRFHHQHVFIDAGTTSVIDLDRSCPSDPAKDVAEFVRVLRFTAFKSGCDMRRADKATTTFLAEYFAACPETAGGLSYHWASFVILGLFGLLKKRDVDLLKLDSLKDFHLKELERALETSL